MPSRGDYNYYEGSNLPWENPFHMEGDAMLLPQSVNSSLECQPRLWFSKERASTACVQSGTLGIFCLEQLMEPKIKVPVSLRVSAQNVCSGKAKILQSPSLLKTKVNDKEESKRSDFGKDSWLTDPGEPGCNCQQRALLLW